MNSAHPVYQVRDIRKSYKDRQILQVDNLEIYPGEILALVGPSGAGKSTFLRLLNFLEPPTQGEIIFHDQVFSSEKDISLDLRRKVTTVFQRPMLLNRSVGANIRFGLDLRGSNHSGDRVRAVLADVGLSGFEHEKARTLSGGEAQRVALARAMVIRPEVLLLDEPTANLDPYNVGLIEKIVLDLNQQQKTTLVLVTHNVFQARRLAHRVALLLDGRIIEVAGAEKFFNHPSDPRTGAFVRGDMAY
jgi:tungstate transport system ATP-binding protein